jgi:hypothetical protein
MDELRKPSPVLEFVLFRKHWIYPEEYKTGLPRHAPGFPAGQAVLHGE